MKGLIQKEWYTAMKQSRMYLLVVLVMGIVSVPVNHSMNLFFVVYASTMGDIAAINLFGIDEVSRWEVYAAGLPYSRKQIVSVRYLSHLCVTAAAAVILMGAQLLRKDGSPLQVLCIQFTIAFLPSAVSFPITYKWGVLKTKLVNLFSIMLIVMVLGAIYDIAGAAESGAMRQSVTLWWAALISAVLYAASLPLSVHFYEKRELS